MSLQLFDVPDVDYRYEASREVEFQPALTGIQPITFSIPGSDDYYDPNSLRFKVKVRLTDPAAGYAGLKANLANSDANNTRNTYCVNNFGHTIFRDITMSMNGVLMTEQSNTYHYRAYLETLLNYSRDEGATKLAPQGWVNQLNVIEEMGATGANSEKPQVWPRKPWIGKRGKPRDGTDSETPCCAPFPTEATSTTIATWRQVI